MAQRAKAAIDKVTQKLSVGDTQAARFELGKVRELAVSEPLLVPAGLTAEKLHELEHMIESLPYAAMQVLKNAKSPFSALGIPRLAEARILNTVNKRGILKNYRRLAIQLHPDKCDHPMALEAMQALNTAFDKTKPPEPKKAQPKRPGPGARRPGARR